MDSQDKFWLLFWVMVVILALGIVSQITGCITKNNQDELTVVNNAIQKGVDPIVTKCAIMINNSKISSDSKSNDTMICLNAVKR